MFCRLESGLIRIYAVRPRKTRVHMLKTQCMFVESLHFWRRRRVLGISAVTRRGQRGSCNEMLMGPQRSRYHWGAPAALLLPLKC